jgi:hypothetical protein
VSVVPRETARRKLRRLKARGWITRDEAGRWSLVVDPDGMDVPAQHDLADLDASTPSRVARPVAEFERLADPRIAAESARRPRGRSVHPRCGRLTGGAAAGPPVRAVARFRLAYLADYVPPRHEKGLPCSIPPSDA